MELASADVATDLRLLDGYVGRYQFAPPFILTVPREAERLFASGANL
jgi:hypothetical protein